MYLVKLSFIIKEEIKIIHDKQKLKESRTTNPALQKIYKGILCTEEEDTCNQKNTGKNKSHYTSRLANEALERSRHHKNNKMSGNTTCLSTLTLNVNSLNTTIKRQRGGFD
jgi:hypothetical protein